MPPPPAGPLPAPRAPGGPYRISVVCLGNICRSPIAEVVLSARLDDAGRGDVDVVSAGTAGWHVGKPMDGRASAVLAAHGYDASRHRASRFEARSLAECDLVLAMDRRNHADIRALFPAGTRDRDGHRLRLFRDFDPVAGPGDRDVPDPYYGGADAFAEVLAIVERTSAQIVAGVAAF